MRPQRIPLAVALLAAVLGLAAAQRPATSAADAQSLFNGRDLTGWDGDPRFWSVKDGAITGETTAENPTQGNTFLLWKGGTVGDFELRAKFRLGGHNSGIQYRSKHLGNWVVGGYQADMDEANQYTGILYEERGRGILAQVGQKVVIKDDGKPQPDGSVGDPAEIRAAIKKGDWNEYVITAQGNHLVHRINGKVTAEATDEDTARRTMRGILALQLHAGKPMIVQFKDITLKDLTPRESLLDWSSVGNDPGGQRYSPLKQITKENVAGLKQAWVYHTGDMRRGTTIECTPVVANGVMYVTTCNPFVKVAALDAATGRELWRYDAWGEEVRRGRTVAGGVNRGLGFWSDGKPGGERRVIFATADARLISLNAATGRPDSSFGNDGTVDLREGLTAELRNQGYGCTSAPTVYKDLVILPFSVSEGPRPGAPGDVRAFNVRSGKEAWRFHTVPQPGEPFHDTWESDAWQNRSGVNPWGGFTVDAKRGIVFAGVGSAAYDWSGADRKGNNLFANCTLALDANTGKRLWHFQVVHHDTWDYDLPCPPVTVTVRHGGKTIDAVAQVTKSGYCYLFDRVSGKPLFPIEERKVPQSDISEEWTAPTQPIPVKPPPLTITKITEADITNLSPEAHAEAVERFRKLRHDGPFTPASERGSLAVPGFHGGATWSGASYNPELGYLFVNTNNTPVVLALAKPEGSKSYMLQRSQSGRSHTGRGLDVFYFNDKDGYPGVKPPWGQLIAINLNTGEFAWKVPLGEYPELAAKGIPRTGTENFGGTIATASGLVFIGGAQDERLHAFDAATGKLLWEGQLDAGGYATPCTYMANGKQYVVIAAGGGGKIGSRSGDAYVAYALP